MLLRFVVFSGCFIKINLRANGYIFVCLEAACGGISPWSDHWEGSDPKA